METSNAELLVLGLGGTVDYEISWNNDVFQELVDSYSIKIHDVVKSEVIRSERELVCTVLACLLHSTGGETQVESSEIVKSFSARFEKEITLGGTGVRAAIAMRKFGITTTQHLVSIDDNVRRLLPEGSKYVCSADTDSFDPHLIIQFNPSAAVNVGEKLIQPSKADRIILTCDPPNEILLISPELKDILPNAHVFLISGFNSIHEREILESRLEQVKTASTHLSDKGLIFFEDAGYHRPEFREIVMKNISQYCHFFSMNEEELQNYLDRKVDFTNAQIVVEALEAIRSVVKVPNLIIHTKAWSVMLGANSKDYEATLFSGMAMATTRYVYGDAFTVENFASTKALPRNIGALSIASVVNDRLGQTGLLVPAFEVECASPTTIGLGDSFVGGFLLELSTKLR